ncbi:ATPase domain-containing protein [Methanolobus sediminis]|uniref:ATPase domain-containing protein n=1 Tax=Methanolobus sediminis TaxID=3072978 RepID=A0AA51YKD3_9EURY|nr:ATPase domain-containing protein [Methanolobus sediminis]WMW26470.1 ATPase domain-containing protein [Methanolobus sediminis]
MRSPSYITKLDDLLYGGLIKPSSILIAGSCGTGKTNLCMQSLFNAAREGEKCAYVSLLSESKDKILRAISSFSFYDEKLIGNKLKVFSINSDVVAKGDFAIFEYINENILKDKPSRVVIDTMNILEDIESTFDERPFHKSELRAFVQNLLQEFDDNNILLMATGEIPATDINSSQWSYIFDTVIVLDKANGDDNSYRFLEIIKERGSDFIAGKHKFSITNDGIIF